LDHLGLYDFQIGAEIGAWLGSGLGAALAWMVRVAIDPDV
jgi:hypothetical protein